MAKPGVLFNDYSVDGLIAAVKKFESSNSVQPIVLLKLKSFLKKDS